MDLAQREQNKNERKVVMENKVVKIVAGDIFNCDADAILQQVDCDGKVRNSISSQIFKKYPVILNWYKARCDEDTKMKNISGSKSALLGFPQVCYKEDYLISDVKDPQVIINLFTYENGCFSPKALSSCLQWVNKHYSGKKIAIPYLKKQENSKSWFDLFEIITKELTDCDVTLYAIRE